MGKYENNWDYLIRKENQPMARVKQIQAINLKKYFRRGHSLDKQIKLEPEEPVVQTRTYRKNPKNRIWKNGKAQNGLNSYSTRESDECNDERSADDIDKNCRSVQIKRACFSNQQPKKVIDILNKNKSKKQAVKFAKIKSKQIVKNKPAKAQLKSKVINSKKSLLRELDAHQFDQSR